MILPAFLLAVIFLPASSPEAPCAIVLSRAWWLRMTLASMSLAWRTGWLSNQAGRPTIGSGSAISVSVKGAGGP